MGDVSESLAGEPTIGEIKLALKWASLMTRYAPKLKGESVNRLRSLRHAKSTWVGADEVALSFVIDKYLRENDQ